MKKKDKDLKWRKLDNSAKVFPLIEGKKYSTVFRISAVLNEDIDKDVLQRAVEKALNRYRSYKVRMKRGFFWYYLEENEAKIKVEKERDYPCKHIDPKTNNNYIFKVTYFKNKINVDIFHSLTDGNGGKDFFREIIYTYIELKHPDVFNKEYRIPRIIENNTEDGYIKNYDKVKRTRKAQKQAYMIKGPQLPLGATGVIHGIIDIEELKKVCKEKNVTVTELLTANLIYSIYTENMKNDCKKPIRTCVPVDLRRYFSSKTMTNFFSYMILEANMGKDRLHNFEDILAFVKSDFEKQLDKEEMLKTITESVRLWTNIIARLVPLRIKEFFVKLGYRVIRRYMTVTFSNIGRIGFIGKYMDYIKYCMILIAPGHYERIKCSSCTYENNFVFTFTTILNDIKIEKRFFELLKEQGIKVEIESNGVLDAIS